MDSNLAAVLTLFIINVIMFLGCLRFRKTMKTFEKETDKIMEDIIREQEDLIQKQKDLIEKYS
ncbi:hypothetical protein [Bartonella sp. C271]|uniref:hypothetical protein n=1 Tax=Bartonella sp. C271 TaxID=3070220 RepID=UPI0038B4F080